MVLAKRGQFIRKWSRLMKDRLHLMEGVGIMDRQNRPRRWNCGRRYIPRTENLENRDLPATFAPFSSSTLFSSSSYSQLSSRAAIVRHEYDQYVGELKSLELRSRATPAEYLALRDDARAISSAAAATSLSPLAATNKATDVSLQLDRSLLYGWAGDSGWAVVSARLTTNLEGLAVPQPLIDHTLADMKAVAVSAGVSATDFQTFTSDFNTLRDGESSLPPNSYYHFTDPGLYYTQHLRGFFRDWGRQKLAAAAGLERDLRSIQSEARPAPAGATVLHRDVKILESLGAAVPSASNQQIGDAYLTAFAQDTPTSDAQAQLRASVFLILGPAATAARTQSVNRLADDAPAFYSAVGSSESAILTIVSDVAAVVDSGGGETLNPFKVTVLRASRGRGHG